MNVLHDLPILKLAWGKNESQLKEFTENWGWEEIEKDGLKVTQVLDASLESAKLGKKVLINQGD